MIGDLRADSPLMGGHQVAERYILVDRLGEGGMAGVFRIWDTRLRVWRAMKILFPEFAKKSKVRERFESEAHTMAKLEHRNIVRVYDVGTDGRLPFLVMEVVDGGCLIDWCEKHGPMPHRMATQCLIDLCEGVLAAHNQGVVHRDIKPHNVLVNRDGMCKLTDFGIAQLQDFSKTKTGSVMGTMGYMAPEQRNDAKSVDVRADVYAIGATYWKMLTAAPVRDLFMAEDDPEMMEGVLEPAAEVILRCVQYGRDRRYPDVGELLAALRQVLTVLPEDPPSPPLVTEPKKSDLPDVPQTFDEIAEMFGAPEPESGPPAPASQSDVSSLSSEGAIPYYMPSKEQALASATLHQENPDYVPSYIDQDASSEGTFDEAPKPSRFADSSQSSEPALDVAKEPTPVVPPVGDAGVPESLMAALKVLVPLGALGFFAACGFVVSGSLLVGDAYESAAVERDNLHATMTSEAAVVELLGKRGADRKALSEKFLVFLDAKGLVDRNRAAEEFLKQLDAELGRVDAAGLDAGTRDRLGKLKQARQQYAASFESYNEARSSLRGGLAEFAGLTQPEELLQAVE